MIFWCKNIFSKTNLNINIILYRRNMHLVLLYVFFANYILAKESNAESRVFLRYNYEGVTEVYNPSLF